MCVERLMEKHSPSLETIKMQVYFDMNYTTKGNSKTSSIYFFCIHVICIDINCEHSLKYQLIVLGYWLQIIACDSFCHK